MTKATKFFLLTILLVVSISFVLADFNDCWNVEGNTQELCEAVGGGDVCQWTTSATDPWCSSDIGCCLDKGCWDYDGTDSSTCLANDGTMNCTWDSYSTIYYPNGSAAPAGMCMMDYSTGDMAWSGMSEGCWNFDADKASCTSSTNAQKCNWKENDANENSWCWIKTLADAQNENPSATLTDVGCCEMKGCWNYDGDQTSCENNTAFKDLCAYDSDWGGCMTKSCNEVFGEDNCTVMTQNLMMPCSWDGDSCEDSYSSGGFGFYNDTDSCMNVGGWYNSSGACVMPTGDDFGGGGGGFMFASEVHCWFADNQANICRNLTGCAYCTEGGAIQPFGILNTSADNICANKPAGFCEGHDTWDRNDYTNADNGVSLNCTHINVKSACEYGPLPSCKWTNSSISTGAFCDIGTSSATKSAPPVSYCEDPESKNNYTMCNDLITKYMMPCKWDNSSSLIKNCTFNSKAVFGNENEIEYEIITNENSCTASGGTWNSEYYLENDILKQDAWCEMTGFFDVANSQGMSGKSNCDENCWACEFQSNGTSWSTQSAAETACLGSALGYCKWTNETTSSFNGQGWCDYPAEMAYSGAKDCNTECEGCNFMALPYDACIVSPANNGTGCKWANESGTSAGACVDATKKVCDSDCFSCYDFDSCLNASSTSCAWDSSFGLCKPQGFSGEICFDGVDNDGDSLTDCADPDCGFDNFCGGSNVGGDCFTYTDATNCNNSLAFGGLNCTWLNDTWNTDGWCDMPGANCWKFDNDLATCGETSGCTNDSSSMGMSNFCAMNMTLSNDADCWGNSDYSDCIAAENCAWKNNTNWETGEDMDGGWCDFAPFAQCMNLNTSTCNNNNNCTWNTDEYSTMGGWCDIACFNNSLAGSDCTDASDIVGLCENMDAGAMCQPSTFMMMGTSVGGKTGCWQHDGNETACNAQDVTCTYQVDTYANNNLSVNAGWCMDKAEYNHFGDMKGAPVMLSIDSVNMDGSLEPGVSAWVDIAGNGIRVTDDAFTFGGGTMNITDAMMCRGYNVGTGPGQTPDLGTGNKTTNFYWYLDTDGVETGGCNAIDSDLSSLPGFEFYIVYSARNTSNGLKETKQLMKCNGGIWTSTNALITPSKKMGCAEISGVLVGIDKQGLEAFSEYNKTADMRVLMVSADAVKNRTNPSDSVGPGYYTQGSVDFGFVDCSDPTTKDPKCKNIQKFGFNVFEECMNGIDDDENGLIDCSDPMCAFMPKCDGDFNFDVVSGDNTAPTVMFNEIEELHNMVTIKTDTNEPSNLTLEFYRNDSQCLSANINKTLYDLGSDFAANANYKPFHYMTLDDSSVGYDLVNGTSYYYKIKVCDTSENCAISACSNFTTKKKDSYKPFIFKMDLPAGYTVDIPALNKTAYNFTETFEINGVAQTFDVGIKTNASVTKDINITVHCGDQSIGFYGVDLLKPSKIDLTEAFVCDQTNNLMGMNSSLKKWNTLIGDLGIGGASDYLEIGLPVAYSASNTFKWTDDGGSNPQTVNSFTNCSGDTTSTSCKVPVSMGFSAYTITTPTAADTTTTGGSSGSSAAVPKGGLTYTISDTQFKDGYTRNLAAKDKINFEVSGEIHSVTMDEVGSSTVTITIASTPQEATLSLSDLRKFDITGSGYYDLSIVLESIDNSGNGTAEITIKSIYEVVTEETIAEEDAKEKAAQKESENEIGFKWKSSYWKWIGIILGIVIGFIVVKFGLKKFNDGGFSNLTSKVKIFQKKGQASITVIPDDDKILKKKGKKK